MTDAQKAAGYCRHHGCVFVSTPPLFTSLFTLASGCDPQASTDLLHRVRPTREAVAARDRNCGAFLQPAFHCGQQLRGIRLRASLREDHTCGSSRIEVGIGIGGCEKMNSPFAWGTARTRP